MNKSRLSIISINRNLSIYEIEILENMAKNYTISDIYLKVPNPFCVYEFEILCYRQAYKDYLMNEYKIDQLIQEIIKYDYEEM
jgi:hypothetical protein